MIESYNPLTDEMVRVLDEEGRVVREDLEPPLGEEDLLRLYRFMVLAREADRKAFSLQREGRMGTYAPLKGQEATQVGAAYALSEEDWIFPIYRDLAAMVVRGAPLHLIYLYWMGDERGSHFPEGVKVFPISIPVGSQIPIAVGFAWAKKIKREPGITLVFFGDGATSEGDFHDGMNFAGLFKTPTVFLCENNQWAISVPRSRQTASRTIAQKALAYGFNGIQVDGNDCLAVYRVVKEAADRARRGEGPTLIEAVTYRLGDHTTADDASRYRKEEEVKEWEAREPLKRFRNYLFHKGILNEGLEREMEGEIKREVEEAVKKAEETPPPGPEDIFLYTYSEMPWHLKEELEDLKDSLREG